MRLVERRGALVLEDSPGLHWLLGLLFAGVGTLFALAGLGLASDIAARAWWQRALVVVLGAGAIGVGLWVLERSPYSRVHVDGRAGRIRMVRYGIRGRRVAEWPVSAVRAVQLAESHDDEGGEVFQVHLVMDDARVIPVSEVWAHGRQPLAQAAARLTAALGLRAP